MSKRQYKNYLHHLDHTIVSRDVTSIVLGAVIVVLAVFALIVYVVAK